MHCFKHVVKQFLCISIMSQVLIAVGIVQLSLILSVADVMVTYNDIASENEFQMVYRHMIYSPETDKQI
jgi:hypothetical protein